MKPPDDESEWKEFLYGFSFLILYVATLTVIPLVVSIVSWVVLRWIWVMAQAILRPVWNLIFG